MTKREKAYIEMYQNSTDLILDDVYRNWSNAKYIAWKNCVKKYRAENGINFRIISHNCCFFSVAWLTRDFRLHVITPSRDFYIEYTPF